MAFWKINFNIDVDSIASEVNTDNENVIQCKCDQCSKVTTYIYQQNLNLSCHHQKNIQMLSISIALNNAKLKPIIVNFKGNGELFYKEYYRILSENLLDDLTLH